MKTLRLAIGSIMICAISYSLDPAAVMAQGIEFDIPQQPLASALAEFAARTKLQVLYSGELTRGLHTTGVAGRYEPEEALQLLLKDTGLEYRFTDSQTVTLDSKTSLTNPPGSPTPPTQGAPRSSDAKANLQLDQKPVKVPEIVVKDVREKDNANSYVAEESNTATRTDTPLLQVPQSVGVVTRQVMDDQKVIRLEQALRNISGVALGDSVQADIANDVVFCRGFPCAYFKNYLRNEPQNQTGTFRDVANMQRLEVLKGPASVLYGRNEPGGIINILTKQPQVDRYASVEQIVGATTTIAR